MIVLADTAPVAPATLCTGAAAAVLPRIIVLANISLIFKLLARIVPATILLDEIN